MVHTRPDVRARCGTAGMALTAWALLVAVDLAVQPARGLANPEGTDYPAYVTGARLLREHAGAALYTFEAQLRAQTALLGHSPTTGLSTYAYPPLMAWLLQPLAALPLTTGLAIWEAILLAAAIGAVAVFRTLLPAAWSPWRRTGVALACGGLLAGNDGVAFAQPTPLILLAVALAAQRLTRGGDSVMAGALLAAALCKPQLFWLLPPALVAARAWRTTAGLLAGAAVWLASSVLLVGVDGVVRLVRDFIPAAYTAQARAGAGLPSILIAVGFPEAHALASGAALALPAIAALVLVRRPLRRDPALAAALGIAVSALLSPHALGRDLALLAVALVLLASRRTAVMTGLAVLQGGAFLVDDRWQGAPLHLETATTVAALAVILVGTARGDRRAGAPGGTVTTEAVPRGADLPAASGEQLLAG